METSAPYKRKLLAAFMITICVVLIVAQFLGPDVSDRVAWTNHAPKIAYTATNGCRGELQLDSDAEIILGRSQAPSSNLILEALRDKDAQLPDGFPEALPEGSRALHLVYTRFFQGQAYASIRERVLLFATFTMSSMVRARGDLPTFWLLNGDPGEIQPTLRDVIEQLIEPYPWIIFTHNNVIPWQDAFRERYAPDVLITSRLDADDAIHRDSIAYLHFHANNLSKEFDLQIVTTRHGYQWWSHANIYGDLPIPSDAIPSSAASSATATASSANATKSQTSELDKTAKSTISTADAQPYGWFAPIDNENIAIMQSLMVGKEWQEKYPKLSVYSFKHYQPMSISERAPVNESRQPEPVIDYFPKGVGYIYVHTDTSRSTYIYKRKRSDLNSLKETMLYPENVRFLWEEFGLSPLSLWQLNTYFQLRDSLSLLSGDASWGQ